MGQTGLTVRMDKDLLIREIETPDFPLLQNFLYQAVFTPPGSPPLPPEIIFLPEIFIYVEGFGKQSDCGVVAENGNKVLGMAWTRIIQAFGHIDDNTPELAMSVLPEFRGKGIGTALLAKLFELLRQRRFSQTSLSVDKRNPAVRLYQRAEYELIRENEVDYIMVKKLGECLQKND